MRILSLLIGSFFLISTPFIDATRERLPAIDLLGNSMDVEPGDLDDDGDLDLVIASEFQPNILLFNDGKGHFTNASAERLPQVAHDSEDIALADFDADGDLDIVFVSEDDQINEFYLNDGKGFFTDVSERLGVTGTTNAIIAADFDQDGDLDLAFGNAGQNYLLLNDGKGNFQDQTKKLLPAVLDQTQDLEAGDVDGDGDLDIIAGNEDQNRLYLNDGTGKFTDATEGRLTFWADEREETREADFGDIDGDGDLDLVFANVVFQVGTLAQNRLLLNDGKGYFTDVSEQALVQEEPFLSVDADFWDADEDGDLDLFICNSFGGPFQLFANDGTGQFVDISQESLPDLVGSGIDAEYFDADGDGRGDLYLGNFRMVDFLWLGRKK
ncbi:MAG: FG-GAP repeat domain-containing protein [Bacteroidia bacterium]